MNELRSFYREYPTKIFPKGEIIFHQDEIPRHVYGIKSGVVRAYNLAATGEEQTIAFEIIDDIVPMCWAFATTSKALFYYQAYTDCELYVIDKSVFEERLLGNGNFTRATLRRQVRSYIGTMLQVDAIEKTRANVKLLYTFRYLCLQYGRDVMTDRVKIYVPFTQQELANTMGLTRETTTLEVKKLKEQKVISVRKKYYTIDTSKLNARIDDEYDPGIKVNMLTKTKDL